MNYFYLVVIIFFIALCVYLYTQVLNPSKAKISYGGFGETVLVPNPYAFITWAKGSSPSSEQVWDGGPSFKTTNSSIIHPKVLADYSIAFNQSDTSITITTIKLVTMRYYFSLTDINMNVDFEIEEIKPNDPDKPVKQIIPVAKNIISFSKYDQSRATSFNAFLQPVFTIDSDHKLSLKLSGTRCDTSGCYSKDSFIVLKVEISSETTERAPKE